MAKKLCVISTDYPSEGLPVYVFVEQLVNTLVDMGEEISVVAPQSLTKSFFRHIPVRPTESTYKTRNGNTYKVYRPYVATVGKGKKWLKSVVDYFNRKSIDSCVNKISPDIVYTHFWYNADRILDYVVKKDLPLFVACGEGDDALEQLAETLGEDRRQKMRKAVKGVISVSTENKRKCVSYDLASDRNIIVLPNAVDGSLFYPRERNEAMRKKLNVADDDFLILFVGAFIPRKGGGVLAKAINELNDEKIKVAFIGASMPGESESFDCKGTVYKGRVDHSELPDYYSSADVFVLPTLKEGCSNAIVEALAMGIPVISSDGAFNDDILNEQNSIRISPTDVNALKQAILTLKNDTALYNGKKEHLMVQTGKYTIITRAKSLKEFIEQKV